MNHTHQAADLLTRPYAAGPVWTQPLPCTEMSSVCLLSLWTLYLLDAFMIAWVCRLVYTFVYAILAGPRATRRRHRETPGQMPEHRLVMLRRSPRLLALAQARARARERDGGVCPP
jgi:hypothetical protein